MDLKIFMSIYTSAEKNLKDICPRDEYGKIVLPMVFIARLDSLLEESRERVLALNKKIDDEKADYTYSVFFRETGLNFCNVSPHRLKDFANGGFAESLDKQTAVNEFVLYLDSFSPNVRSVLRDFGIYGEVAELVDKGVLSSVVGDYYNLFSQPSPKDDGYGIIADDSQTVIDNQTMCTLFDMLFDFFFTDGGSGNYDYSTPSDVSRLMSDLLFMPVSDKIGDGEYSVYDGACGLGDTVTSAYNKLSEIAESRGKQAAVNVFGQEKYQIISVVCRALMILRGDNIPTENLEFGSTISHDKFSDRKFDFMISCPPLGKSWKENAEQMGGKKNIDDKRFVNHKGSMVPRLSDSQFLFMLNNVSKMNFDSVLGSRIVELHNGSPFNGGSLTSP